MSAAALAAAEDRLRALGLTGAQAFGALLDGLRARRGAPIAVAPAVAAAVEAVPAELDLVGLAYERFFSDLFKGARGQYFTPPQVVSLMVSLAEVAPGEDVLDPTCGAGGLLVAAARRGARVRGIERDPLLAGLAALQLEDGGGAVTCADWFTWDGPPADVVLANPPFSVRVTDPAALARHGAGGRAWAPSDALVVSALARAVRPGGRVVVALPWSVAFNPRRRGEREALDAAFVVHAAVGLPEGVFRPFGGAGGRAVVFSLVRRPAPQAAEPRWAEVRDPGFDPRSVHIRPTAGGEIEALCAGRGWRPMPAGLAARPPTPGPAPVGVPVGAWVAVGAVAEARSERATVGDLVELGDVDRASGAVRARPGDAVRRPVLRAGDVLVARIRPELGTVTRVPADSAPLRGSFEWIPLAAGPAGGYLACALRTAAFRARLPPTSGQTRPRTSPAAVLATPIRWPGAERAAAWTALSDAVAATRDRARAAQELLQAAAERWESGEGSASELDAAVAAARAALGASVGYDGDGEVP